MNFGQPNFDDEAVTKDRTFSRWWYDWFFRLASIVDAVRGPSFLSFHVAGTLAVGTNQAPVLSLAVSSRPTAIDLLVKTAPAGQSIQVTLKHGATTIGTAEILAGATSGTVSISQTTIPSGAVLTLDVAQVGTVGNEGADLTAMLRF